MLGVSIMLNLVSFYMRNDQNYFDVKHRGVDHM